MCSSDLMVSPTISTIYTLSTVSNSANLNCNLEQTVSVLVLPLPSLSAVASKTSVCKNQSFTLTASGAATYTWNIGPTTPSVVTSSSLVSNMLYTVTGSDNNGCTGFATVLVIVNSCMGLNPVDPFADTYFAYPVPAHSFIVINPVPKETKAELFNVLGQQLGVYELMVQDKGVKLQLPELNSGIYWIVVDQKWIKIMVE